MNTHIPQASSNSKICKDYIPSFVFLLMSKWNPFAILRFIIAIIVNAFNGISSRTSPHIVKKSWKGIKPSIAYDYATSSIVFVMIAFQVCTSSDHVIPAPKRSISCPILVHPVLGKNAATGFCSSIQKCFCKCGMRFSTVTDTNISGVCSMICKKRCGIGYYFKLSKSFTDERFPSRHNNGQFVVLFSDRGRLQPAPVATNLTNQRGDTSA